MLYELDQPRAGEYKFFGQVETVEHGETLYSSAWITVDEDGQRLDGSFFPGLEEDRAMLKAAREELARRKAKGLEE